MAKVRLCLIGSNSPFSLAALQTLLARQVTLYQIILTGYAPATQADKQLPISSPQTVTGTPPTISTLAAQHHIPIHYTGSDIHHFTHGENFAHHTPPDFLLVACFPYRLPAAIRDWPTQLAINLHPSLLPAYRGPDPLFWQLQRNEKKTGISLHVIRESFDSGPILLQTPINLPAGATRQELDSLIARQGCEDFCDQLATDVWRTTEQDPQDASYQALPKPDDYRLETHWSAEHTYNFMRGTQRPVEGYPILLDGKWHHLHSALSFDANQSLNASFIQYPQQLLIQFSPGVLCAKPV